MSKAGDGWKDAEGRRVRLMALRRDKGADAPCWICGKPIDYAAKPGTTPDSWEPDHYLVRSRFPQYACDLGNLRPSHKRCNRARSAKASIDPVGDASGSWRRG